MFLIIANSHVNSGGHLFAISPVTIVVIGMVVTIVMIFMIVVIDLLQKVAFASKPFPLSLSTFLLFLSKFFLSVSSSYRRLLTRTNTLTPTFMTHAGKVWTQFDS